MWKHRFLAMAAAALCICVAVGCAGCAGKGQAGKDDVEEVKATVTVWSPQEDQTDEKGRWLQTECEAFAEEHPEWDLTFRYGVCPEGDAAQKVGTDPEAAADVYMISNDRIPDLLQEGAIVELGGIWVDKIREANTETAVQTVTYEDGIYGVPFAVNTWFMYYDKSVFSKEDVKSLDRMLEKGKVAFPLNNSWYLAAFYVGNGCTLFGEDGMDGDAGIDFGGEKGVQVTEYLADLVKNPRFVTGDVGTHDDAKAFFSGEWDYQKALDRYGENLGIAPAPTFTIDGEAKQMKAFAGSKALAVNPATKLYQNHPEIAVALASWLGRADAQLAHYERRNVIPADITVDVGDDALAAAMMETMEYATVVQPLQVKMSYYWDPASAMGEALANGRVTHGNAAQKTEAMNRAMNTSAVE